MWRKTSYAYVTEFYDAGMLVAVRVVMLMLCLPFMSLANEPQLSDFEKWQKARTAEFAEYISAQDQEFSQFLKQRWVDKTVETVPVKPSTPKLPQAPIAPVKNKQQDYSAPVKVIEPEPLILPAKIIKPDTPTVAVSNFTFLGAPLQLDINPFPTLSIEQLNAQSVAALWQQMAKTNQSALVGQLQQISEQLNLDDWASAYMTHEVIAEFVTGDNTNDKLMYAWYYLVQQGYDVRVGYEASNLYLLLGINAKVYGKKFLTLNNKRYYFIDFAHPNLEPSIKVKTYQKQHAQASKLLSIDLAKLPNVSGALSHRKLNFSFAGQAFDLSVPYSTSYVELLASYPQLELKHYFGVDLLPETKQALLEQLKPLIEGKTEQQALNLLLRFVQKAFDYQTDDEQFNQENFLVATETLHYPYADCEDRSVLYAYLVKQLLGNDVIGVLYKGHIATAIKPHSQLQGAGYNVNGAKYLVADPTYMGADIGEVMPGHGAQSPRLIVIN